MSSKTKIANNAILILGEKRIISLNDNTKAAKVINDLYEGCRDALLEEANWKFAIKQVALATLTSTPLFGYSTISQLPSDCIRILKTEGNVEYRRMQDTVHSNSDPLTVEYLYKETDEGKYSALFAKALAYSLAKEASIRLTEDKTLRAEIEKGAKETLSKARFFDSVGGGTTDVVSADEWTDSRR